MAIQRSTLPRILNSRCCGLRSSYASSSMTKDLQNYGAAEELETALKEMVKQDNRRQLTAKVEQLECDVNELKQALAADKQEQETAMLQILVRVEQEQVTEQDAASQRHIVQVLQGKYEEATAALADMEKRAVMAGSMLEATLQYQSVQNKGPTSPRSTKQSSQDPTQDIPTRKISLLSRPFGLGWRDKNKGKSKKTVDPHEGKTSNKGHNSVVNQEETNGHQKTKI